MNEASIRDGVRRHYEEQSPSAETRERLAGMLRRGPRRAWRWWAAAAAVLLAVAGVWLLDRGGERDLAQAVAQEIARNHVKHPEVDIESGDYAELRRRLDRLDFTLLASADPALAGLRLTGARYCSLQGHVAAQLRLEGPAGERLTLYQARDARTFEGLARETRTVDGLRVTVWREGGVVLGLAAPLR